MVPKTAISFVVFLSSEIRDPAIPLRIPPPAHVLCLQCVNILSLYYRHIYYKYNTWFKFALYGYILFWIKLVILVYTFVKIVLSGYRNLLTWFLVLLVHMYRYRGRYRNIYLVVLYRFASKVRVVYTRVRTWTLFYLTYLVVSVLPCVGTQEHTFLEYTARKISILVCLYIRIFPKVKIWVYIPL